MTHAHTVAPVEATPVKETAPAAIKQHGITRPKAGTKTGRVWEIADNLSAELGSPAPRRNVLLFTGAESINPATAATQYGRWRTFNGLGAEPKAAVESEEVKVEEGAAE